MRSGRIKLNCRVFVPDVEWRPGTTAYAMIEDPPGCEDIIAKAMPIGGRRGTTFLSRLIPGQEIPIHTDNHDNGCRERIHIPLRTNNRAFFLTGGKKVHMRRGYAYTIDPTEPHGVINEGKSDRIHLMFNVLR